METTQVSYLAQVRRLKAFAVEAVKQYPLKIRAIEFIKYSANAIFRVTDTQNKQYMLRIHPEGHHTKEAILEEIKWLHHILKTTDLVVPRPISTSNGQYLIEVKHAKMPITRFCDLFEWLPGKKQWKSINQKYALNLGSAIAQLQKSGQNIPIYHRKYWNADGLVGTDKATLYNIERLTDISEREQQAINMARLTTYNQLKHFEEIHKDKTGLIHADMQPNNFLVYKNEYAIIDFDDCGSGFYGDDLAVALFAFEYITEGNKHKNFDELKEALFNGYSKYMPFTQEDVNLIPYFLLAQKLKTLGWLELRRNNPILRPYFHNAIHRAIYFFERLKLD